MIPDHASRCAAFKALHDRRATFIIPNPFDAGSARVLAAAGFAALATTSAGVAFTLGRRDGMVRREEALANARAIIEATPLPVSADLENCYGHEPEAVAETIRLAFATGLAGGSVEDASGEASDPIYAHDHALARVRAAVEAKRAFPHPFTLTARAEGFLHGRGDLQEVVARLQAFEAAGADVVYAPGLPDLDAVRTVVEAVRCPVNVLMPGRNPFTVEQLRAVGVVRISVGALLSRAALGAVMRAAAEMRDDGTFGWVEQAPPTAEISAMMEGR
ncbi:MAG: isocitrate lyase/phosphoenolpyruvate mutase family protein [Acetobacteraceae bacterium]|nr:isocitrate lyase/phosphoenolpyruvate mutase family protein [Acetobacteraceae bacterium]